MQPLADHSILLHDARKKRWLLFRSPLEVYAAYDTASVLPILQEIEHRVNTENLHAAGFVAYEAAPAFDSALPVLSSGDFPLVWFGLYKDCKPVELPETPVMDLSQVPWTPGVSALNYRIAIQKIKQYILNGDTYQVNFTFRLQAPVDQNLWPLFLNMVRSQKGDYGAFVNTEDWSIASASPELFFSLEDRKLTCRPMKGTVERGLWSDDDLKKAAWLKHSAKNRAENVMIVDMVRNDLGRIADIGTVRISAPYTVEQYPTLWQMTTTVACDTGKSVSEIFQALFPASSITGAPKARTMGIIAELEEAPRRIYTGAIGFIGPGREAQFNVAIRTVLLDKKRHMAEYGVGGGIVWDSEETDELMECGTKTRILRHTKPDFSLLETILWTPGEGYKFLSRHLARLSASAAYFSYPVTLENIRRRLDELATDFPSIPHRIRLLLPQDEDLVLEWTALKPLPEPYKVCLANSPTPTSSPFIYHKTTYRQLYDDALAAFPDNVDVLLWNERQEITESCIANVVVEMNGELLTPPVRCGLLGGIYRAFFLEQGKIREQVIHIADLERCTKIYLINAVRGMWEVSLQIP